MTGFRGNEAAGAGASFGLSGVSVAIITYDRPALLRRCVLSALANLVRPLEIIVSDDAISAESRDVVASVAPPAGVALRHLEGPSIGSQSANARAAIEAASHEALVLMHDDDFLFDGMIDHMLAVWRHSAPEPDAVFGRQRLVRADGEVDPERTRQNDAYYEKTRPPGPQPSALWSALTGQFPNNGMLIRRSTALEAGYPSEAEVGRIPVDFHFALRYAQAARRPFVLTSEYVSAYRFQGESVARAPTLRRGYDGHLGFEILQRVRATTPEEQEAKAAALDRFAAAAAMGYLAAGRPADAWAVYRRHVTRMDKGLAVRLGLGAAVALGGVAPGLAARAFARR